MIRRVGLLLGLSIPLAASVLSAQVHLKPGVTLHQLELAVTRDPYDPAALYDLALGYWSKKRWDDVERTLRAALEIEPRNAPALMALAHLPFARRPKLWDEEEQEKVPPEWQPALIQRDRLTRLAFLIDPLVDLQIVGAVAPSENTLLQGGAGATAERTALVGLTSFRNAQYDQAFAWFDRLARSLGGERDPARVPDFVLYYRGLAAAHLNDIPAAIRDFRRLHAMADSPAAASGLVDPVLATYVLGFLLQRAGNYDEAVTCYQQALTEDLGLWMAHVQLARIHEARSEWVDAIRERNQALEAAPDEASLLLDLGITLALAGRAQEALPVLERAGAKLPHNFRVPYFEGVAALQLDRPAEARRAFELVLTLVPSRNVAEITEVQNRLHSLP
jgi:tetratricopeptide (TPR) repeat protein